MKTEKQKPRSGALVVLASPEIEDMSLCARVKKEISVESHAFSKGLRFGVVTGDLHGPEQWADEYAVVNPGGNILFLRVFSQATGLCKTWKRIRMDGTGFSGENLVEDRWRSAVHSSDAPLGKWLAMLTRSLVFDEVRVLFFYEGQKKFEDTFVGNVSRHFPFFARGVCLAERITSRRSET